MLRSSHTKKNLLPNTIMDVGDNMGKVINLKASKKRKASNKGQEYDAMKNAAKALNDVLARWDVNISDNGKSTAPGFTLSLTWVMYFSNDTNSHEAMLDETVREIMRACTLSGQPNLFYDYLDTVVSYIRGKAQASKIQ